MWSGLGRGLSRSLVVAALLALLAAVAGTPAAADTVGGKLHVCADPANLPFSNEKGEGFENKLVDLIAAKLGMAVVYTWLPQVVGHVARLPDARECDILMGYAQGAGMIEDTNPYYRTSYVLIYRKGDENLAGVTSLSDPRLKDKTIGIVARTPPFSIMALNGLVANAKSFESPGEDAAKAAEDVIAAIASGDVDAGILWGPLGGYYARDEKAGPATVYGITMGLRPKEPELKHRLNKIIAENQDDIYAMLREYNVPLLDENGSLIAAPPTAER
jgi:mxaJ protein